MVWFDRGRDRPGGFRLPPGVRRLSERAASVHRELRTALKGVVLLAAALGLGSWAEGHSSESALRRWRQAHPPSVALWTQVLAAGAWAEVRDEPLRRRLLHEFPGRADSEGETWAASGGGLLARVGRDPEGVRVWARPGALPDPAPIRRKRSRAGSAPQKIAASQPHWEPWGNGWDALQRVMNLPVEAPRARPGAVAQAPWADPRELRF